MDYLYEDLKNKNWDILNNQIPLVKLYINVISDKIHINIIDIKLISKGIKNNFDMSILNLVGNPNKKNVMFELPLFDININSCDILVGFLSHKDAVFDTYLKIILEPRKKSFFSNNICVELITTINKSGFTPFLYNAFPFPRISFANYNIKFICDSLYKPNVLCANVQTLERKQLITSNIFLPIKNPNRELLFQKINKYRRGPDIILPHFKI